jgi:hypothetical protein
MGKDSEPVILELAPLPREQIGPFLLLGLDKGASTKEIEAHWAERIKAARKGQVAAELGDINWAREVLQDAERRIQADVASLNADTAAGALGRLAREFGVADRNQLAWRPLELEEAGEDFDPPVQVPSAQEILAQLAVPPWPQGIPAVAALLKEFVEQPLDPWNLEL